MERVIYYVVEHQGQWKVKLEGTHHGPYATQKDAIRAAVNGAHACGKSGRPAQVLVQGTNNNQWRTEWTYGDDPYPPPG